MKDLSACRGHHSEVGWTPQVPGPGRGRQGLRPRLHPQDLWREGTVTKSSLRERWDTGEQPSGSVRTQQERKPTRPLEEPGANAEVRPPEPGWTSWARLGQGGLSIEGLGGWGHHLVPDLLLGSRASLPTFPARPQLSRRKATPSEPRHASWGRGGLAPSGGRGHRPWAALSLPPGALFSRTDLCSPG